MIGPVACLINLTENSISRQGTYPVDSGGVLVHTYVGTHIFTATGHLKQHLLVQMSQTSSQLLLYEAEDQKTRRLGQSLTTRLRNIRRTTSRFEGGLKAIKATKGFSQEALFRIWNWMISSLDEPGSVSVTRIDVGCDWTGLGGPAGMRAALFPCIGVP